MDRVHFVENKDINKCLKIENQNKVEVLPEKSSSE